MTSYGDPGTWDDDIDYAADDVAQRTNCYVVSYVADFSAANTTGSYALPQGVPRIKLVVVFDSSGTQHDCTPISRWDYEKLYGDSWRTNPSTGTPTWMITGGLSGDLQAVFYPVPNYTTTGNQGYVVEGYGVPAQSWSADSTVCPLPDYAHKCVEIGAALRRAKRYPKDYGVYISILEADYQREMGLVESTAINLSDANRVNDQTRRSR